jgi:putative ABC transport system permease protein
MGPGPMGPGPMGTVTLPAPIRAGTGDGGVPARRAVIRWGLRLFRREWRQQLLVLGMLVVAVAATIWGAGVATNTPPVNPNYGTFGTASGLVTLPGSDPHLAADIASIQRKLGPADVIENENITTGTTQSVQLRAESPHGTYNGPMLGLVSGSYPQGPGQVALTSQVASLYNVHTGSTWHAAGQAWRVTGIVQNPSDLLDEFALVAPGQVTNPSQVIMLLGSPAFRQAADNATAGPPVNGQSRPDLTELPAAATLSFPNPQSSGISPATIVLVVAVLGLVFIGLVSVAGFSVMAQRRLRALGMLSALGATERNVRLVMVANGVAVGVVAAIIGAITGFAAWFAYVPSLQQDTGHVVNSTNLPWWAIGIGIVLAIATSILAARRPATTMARVPVVAALSGRPATPKAVHRSAVPGIVLVAVGVLCLAFSGGWDGNSGSDALLLLGGLVTIITGIFLLAPLGIKVLAAGAGPRMPVAVRIALRDLVRYRARSGAALAATTFAVFLAMLICVIASVRFAKVLDWTGPNLSGNQLIVYTQDQNGGNGAPLTNAQLADLQRQVYGFAAGLHAQSVLPLESAGLTLRQVGTRDNNFTGQVYVATPQLLAAYGIKASQIAPGTDILTMRPGMAGLPNMEMIWGNYGGQFGPGGPGNSGGTCTPSVGCLPDPKMATIGSLPSGTSAPNTVVTEYAMSTYHRDLGLNGWLIQAPGALTATQINAARTLALGYGVTVETKSGELGLGQIADGATALGIIIALGVLAMSVGLIRSETARDLRTLTAAGAGSATRRTITGATAGALGVLGAILGMAGAVIAGLAWARSSLSATFGDVPVPDILLLLVGLPLIAAVGGWLLAGREPQVISGQPLE